MATILEGILVIESSEGKVWKIDKSAGTVTIYASQAEYSSNTPSGTLLIAEANEVFAMVKSFLGVSDTIVNSIE